MSEQTIGFLLIYTDKQGRAEVSHITDTSRNTLEGTILYSELSGDDVGRIAQHSKASVMASLLGQEHEITRVRYDITTSLDLIRPIVVSG